MPTAAYRSLLQGIVALAVCALAVAAEANEGRASATMGVSLTVTGQAIEGERFVSGKGAAAACAQQCAEAPLPTLTFAGAANSGPRKVKNARR